MKQNSSLEKMLSMIIWNVCKLRKRSPGKGCPVVFLIKEKSKETDKLGLNSPKGSTPLLEHHLGNAGDRI